MFIEILIILALISSGAFLLNSFGMRGLIILPLGLICGSIIFTLFFYVQLILLSVSPSLNLSPVIPLITTVVGPFFFWVYKQTAIKQYQSPLPIWTILISVIAISALVALFSVLNLVRFHGDSLNFLMIGSLLHDGHLDAISNYAVRTRLSSVPVIHSLSGLFDSFYLRSFTPLLSISTLWTLWWLIKQGAAKRLPKRQINLYAALAVTLLLTSHAYLFHSFYLNGHLIIATYALIVVGVGWLSSSRDLKISPDVLIAVQSIGAMGLVFTRVEGFLYAILAILPTVLYDKISLGKRKLLLSSVGVAIIIQQSVKATLFGSLNQGQFMEIFPLVLLGAGLILIAHLLAWRWINRHYNLMLLSVEVGLWGVLTFFALRNPEILVNSVKATIQNVAFIPAPWGLFLVALLPLSLLVLILYRYKEQILIRFPLTTFLPTVLVAAYLREASYRVAYADSLNRMLIQIVPLLVLFIIIGIINAQKNSKQKKLT